MSAKDNIFAKLNQAKRASMPEPDVAAYYQEFKPQWSTDIERLKHWSATMRKFKTEIYWVHENTWSETLKKVVQEKNIKQIVLPLATEHGKKANVALNEVAKTTDFNQAIEHWKEELFADIDAGFTDIKAGIAQTGTLVLWPDTTQPRSMSLVPPIHIALLDTSNMYDDFYSAMQGLNMANQMPTNLVLISSPSKTSDIQLTLAFGAHGPRDLVVLAKLPDHISIADLGE